MSDIAPSLTPAGGAALECAIERIGKGIEAMAKAPESVQDAVMDAGRMKAILKLVASGDDEGGGKQRLPIVVGLDKGGEGVVSVGKKGKPKKLRQEMIKAVTDQKLTGKIDADNSHLYFGYAYTRDDAPGILQIDVNKKPSGESKLATQVHKRVRSAGFAEVVFNVNEALEAESDQDEDAASAPPPPPNAPPPPPPQAAAPAQNLGDLQKQLAVLIPRIGPAAGEDAGVRAKLMKFATDANVNLKTNNLNYAAEAIGQLKAALDAGGTTGATPSAAAAAGAVTYAKSRLAWMAARKKVEGEIEKLRAQIVATYQADGVAADLDKRYSERVTPLLTTLDESLADKLDEATNATDPAARAKLVGEARAILTRYQGFVSGAPIIADLDANPFVPLVIAQTLSATLTGLSAAIR